MRVWTYGEGLAKLDLELDLTNETFILDDEMAGLWNDSVQRAAAVIYKLGVEDEYFTRQAPLQLINGQARYSPPADIYACKIRGLVYQKGDEIYPIRRLRRRAKFVKISEINQFAQDVLYQYDIENPSVATGYQIVLVPPSRENDTPGSESVTLHYIREVLYIPLPSAGSLAASKATKLDIPQFMTFIFADVKLAVARKIPHPNLMVFKAERDEELKAMVDSLTEMVADDATEVEPDMSHYWRST